MVKMNNFLPLIVSRSEYSNIMNFFVPIIAIALLASHAFKNKWIAILIPLSGMWISDLVINNYLYAGYYDKFVFFSIQFFKYFHGNCPI